MPADLAERRTALYDPARLDQRMIWFEHVFLPGLRAQTDPDFTMIVVTGEDFPEPWRGRLAALARSVPQIKLVFLPPGSHGEGPRDALRDHIDPGADVVAQFRQDDDDAVSVDFVHRVRQLFTGRLRPLFEIQSRLMLDFARGFILAGHDGVLSLYPLTAQSWAVAQVIYLRPDDEQTVMAFPHKHVFRHMTSVSLVDRVMYVRGVHDWNDSGIREHKLPERLPAARAREWIANRFGIDLDAVARALGLDTGR